MKDLTLSPRFMTSNLNLSWNVVTFFLPSSKTFIRVFISVAINLFVSLKLKLLLLLVVVVVAAAAVVVVVAGVVVVVAVVV